MLDAVYEDFNPTFLGGFIEKAYPRRSPLFKIEEPFIELKDYSLKLINTWRVEKLKQRITRIWLIVY